MKSFFSFQLPESLKIALLSAVVLSLVWILSPNRSIVQSEEGVVEITYMGPSGPISGAMDDAVKVFEEESRRAHELDPSVPVYRVISGQTAMRNQTEDPTRFLLSVAGDMPPDVIYFDRFAVAEWSARDAFTDLIPFIEKDLAEGNPDAVNLDDYYAPTIKEVTFTHPVSGKHGIYGIPDAFESRVLFYNKDWLKRAGYVDENGEARPPKTWKELEEMAINLSEWDENGNLKRVGFVPNYGNSFLYMYGWLNGGSLLADDGRKVTLNSPEFVEALEYMVNIYDRLGGIREAKAFESTLQSNDLGPFLSGQIAMKIDGYWGLSMSLTRFGQNMNYGFVPPPLPEKELARGKHSTTWIGGWCYSIPESSRNKEHAWALIRFLTSPRARRLMAESQRLTNISQGRTYIPSQTAHREINEEIMDKYIYSNPAIAQKIKDGARVFNDIVPYAHFRPATPVGNLMFVKSNFSFEAAAYHMDTPQNILDFNNAIVQQELDRVLAPPQGTPVNWNPLVWIYLFIVVCFVLFIYFWDTSSRLRQWCVKPLQLVGLGKRVVAAGVVEGATSSIYRRQWMDGVLCAFPWILGFLVFMGGPILFSIVISFCEYEILNPATWTGLDNYRRMFGEDELFLPSVVNTLYMIIGIPVGMAVSLGISLLLNLKIKGIAVWRTFFYLPSIVPIVASSILWIWIFNPNSGLLNAALGAFGIEGPNWLQDASTSKLALIIMGLWAAGGGMIIWLAGLKGIPESYYEAALIDGANTWQRFWNITIPMLTPYIFFNLIMGVIGTLQIFAQSFIMTNGGPVNSTLFYVYHLFNHAFRYLNMGYASALAWILFIVIFLLTIIQLHFSKKWVHYEGD